MITLRLDSALRARQAEVASVLSRSAEQFRQPAGPGAIVDEPGWRTLVDAGLFQLDDPAVGVRTTLASAIAGEAAGRHLVPMSYLDTLFVIDVLRQLEEQTAQLAAQISAGRIVPALAVDRRLGLRGVADTGEIRVSTNVRGATIDGELRLVRGARRSDRIVAVAPAAGGLVIAVLPTRGPDIESYPTPDLDRGELCLVRLRQVLVRTAELHCIPVPCAQRWAGAVDRARIRLAGHLVGVAEGAVATAITHVRTRVQFGRPLTSFQAVTFPLAAALARIRAVRLLYQHAAWVADEGGDTEQLAAQALATAAELAVTASAQAIQAHGASGLTEAADVQRYYRRALSGSVWLGTAGSLAEVAAAGLGKGTAHRLGQESA